MQALKTASTNASKFCQITTGIYCQYERLKILSNSFLLSEQTLQNSALLLLITSTNASEFCPTTIYCQYERLKILSNVEWLANPSTYMGMGG